ncbi:small GTPase superfamily [Mycena polygramma]|nr:small GTPase superfamily [Mycena polygramma]
MDEWTVTVLGDGSVGKTALAVRTYDPTIEDAYRKQFSVDNRACFVEVIDTAGQDDYQSLHDQWVRAGQGFAIVFSITSRDSFARAEFLQQSVRRLKQEDPVMVLVGNKADIGTHREVSSKEGEALAQKFGCKYIETSAKTSENVQRVFVELVRSLRSRANLPSQLNERRQKKCIIM